MSWWMAAALAGVGVGEAPTGLHDALAPRRVALVVGLDAYGGELGLSSLDYAAADARAMGQLLSGEGYEVTALTGQADEVAFWQAWGEATAALHHGDRFVLYFAGHAELAAAAGDDGHALDLLFSDGSRASLERLSSAVAELPPLQRVVVLDTCYSARTRDWLARQRGAVPVARPTVGRFDAWLFAAAPRQSAQEDAALGHGVFTHYLLQALSGQADADGDGQVGVLEAHAWAGQRTAEHTGGAQVPSLRAERVGWSDLPLTGVAATPRFGVLGWEPFEVRIDGQARGPGSVAPGRHEVEVLDGDEVLLRRRVRVQGGEVLRPGRWVQRARPYALVGAGGSVLSADGRVPPMEGQLVARFGLPRRRGMRAAWGLRLGGARGALGEAEGWAVSAAVQGLWLGAVGPVELGPSVELGLATRRPPAGWQATPRAGVGGAAKVRWGRAVLGLDGTMGWLTVDGVARAQPRAGLFVGGTWAEWRASTGR
jgi:hypothetical protein